MALNTGISRWPRKRSLACVCLVTFVMGMLLLVISSWASLPLHTARYPAHDMITTNVIPSRKASLQANASNDNSHPPTLSTVDASTVLDVLRDFVARTPLTPTEDLLTYVTDILRHQEWKHNKRNSNYFKLKFQESINMSTYDNIMMTRNNSKPPRKTKTDDPKWQMLPQETLLPPRPPYNSCSVVGNSGILLGSQCGHEIDKADMVFRFNVAPTWGFQTDVGTKTNMTTMNPTIPINIYGRLKNATYVDKFVSWMSKQSGLVWSPPAWSKQTTKISLNAIKIGRTANANLTFAFANMEHFNAVGRFWRQFGGIKKVSSTGFYFISSALDLCTQVNVFGFWSFNVTIDGRKTGYHYFDDIVANNTKHNMNSEFRTLVGLHQSGLLRLHVGNCTYMP